MKSHRLFRGFQASVDAKDLQNLESELRNTDLILGVVIGVMNDTPRFLPPTEGFNSKPVIQQIDNCGLGERERLDAAENFIFDRCFKCLRQMKPQGLCRLFQASVDARDLQKREDLILRVVIGVMKNTPRFLPLTERHDSKPDSM